MIKGKELTELIAEINKIDFPGLESIKIGDALYYLLYYYENKSFSIELKQILSPVLRGHYMIDRTGEGRITFLFSSSYEDRKDHREKFDKVTEIISEGTVVSYHRGIYLKNIPHLAKIPKIIKLLDVIKTPITSQLKRFIAYWICNFYCEIDELKKLKIFDNGGVIVSYCDVMPVDSAIIQYSNKMAMTTVTLQHGQFNIKAEIGITAYEKSFSDYFLCFGPYTVNSCRELKVDLSKMIPVGQPEMIGKNLPDRMHKMDHECFGIVLGYFEFEEENQKLLQIAMDISYRIGEKGYIRPHPSLNTDDYKKYIDGTNLVFSTKGETMDEFLNKVDFAVVGSSSVFQTFVVNIVQIYRYVMDDEHNLFRGIDWCAFSDSEGLYTSIMNLYKYPEEVEKRLIETRGELVGQGVLADNYRDFFDSIKV